MIPPVVDQSFIDGPVPGLVVADVRWYLDGRSGSAAYTSGHIPGAVFVDLDRWLAGPPGPGVGRHPLPDPAVFAVGMGSVGISNTSTVVAYDDGGGTIAARLVWMLRSIGTDAALLDGGLAGYVGPLSTGTLSPPASPPTGPGVTPAVFESRPWPTDRLASIDDAGSPDFVVIDARAADRFSGETEPVDPKGGHIPGALNLPCSGNLDGHGRFLPPDELRRRFESTGASDGSLVV